MADGIMLVLGKVRSDMQFFQQVVESENKVEKTLYWQHVQHFKGISCQVANLNYCHYITALHRTNLTFQSFKRR